MVGWLGWSWAELEVQPPPRGEFWVTCYQDKSAKSCMIVMIKKPL